MTKKDFELLASAMQDAARLDNDDEHVNSVRSTAHCLADALARTNPRFDRDRFLRACVPGANVRARS